MKQFASSFRRGSLVLLSAAVFGLGLSRGAAAHQADKNGLTPIFCQRDKVAGFENEGRDYCAVTSLSDGLIYLAQVRGLAGLVPGYGHDEQIELIKDLADETKTDPKLGTNPDNLLSGLLDYTAKRGFACDRLEIATWRGIGKARRQYRVGIKPGLGWMNDAARDPDCVEIFNFGWYKEQDDGTYTRDGGHWVIAVGMGASVQDFELHNPILQPEKQKVDSTISLDLLDKNFVVNKTGDDQSDMAGYYQATGPGLPFNRKTTVAVLDAVLVFTIKKL